MANSIAHQSAFASLTKQGVITVARTTAQVDEPYRKETIPEYLDAVDHTLSSPDKKAYKVALKDEEKILNLLVRRMAAQNQAVVIVLQGRDGAGKTGATMRIAEALGYDYKIFASVPISAPTVEELNHGFLWRFTKNERWPAFGQLRVFDRSWAERLLVERAMKITPPEQINDSYATIRMFEKLWTMQGITVVKIWLDITKDEQKKRFKARKNDKPWKISDSDAVARKHWDDYTPAANELFHRTGTDYAPWHLISSEDKRYSRITVLRVVNQALRKALGPEKD
jgi:polyphosphate kinase 2 (PPK2 family)